MAQSPQRGGVRDLNVERAAQQDQNQMIQSVDTFAPVQSTVFGQTQVQGNKLMNSLAKFGTEIGAIEFEKQQKAAFLKGQTMRAAGEEMLDSPAPPTRRGYKAMDAKIKTQEWYAEQQAAIDNGENGVDPMDYSSMVAGRIKSMLTGDRETDSMITEAALPMVTELGRYQTNANVKRRKTEAITQSTADVMGNVRAVKAAQKENDVKGEAAARQRLAGALTLPVIVDPALRLQTYSELAAMSLSVGDPTALNYVREQGMQFSPEQERSLIAAESTYTANKKGKLDVQYQHGLADLENGVNNAGSIQQVREMSAEFQQQYPNQKTNAYYAGLESRFRQAQASKMGTKISTEAWRNDALAGQQTLTHGQRQDAIQAGEAEVMANPELTPEEANEFNMERWASNNLKYDHKSTKWNAGMTNPLLPNGEISPAFEQTFTDLEEHHARNPDLTLQHMTEDNRLRFLSLQSMSRGGGHPLRDAAVMLEQNKKNLRVLTAKETTDVKTEVADAVSAIMGEDFFSGRAITDFFNVTVPIKNKGAITERITNLTKAYMQTGYPDAEAAAKAARIRIMETNTQIGDALVYEGETPIYQRMNIPATELNAAVEYQKTAILEANPDFDADTLTIIGDPMNNALIYANMSQDGIPLDMVSVDLAGAGAAYSEDVLKPKRRNQMREVAGAVKEQQQKMQLHAEAIKSGIYTEKTSEAALSNWLGSMVVQYRMDDIAKESQTGRRETLRQEVLSSGVLQADVESGARTQAEVDQFIETVIDTQLDMERTEAALGSVAGEQQKKVMKDNGLTSDDEYRAFTRMQEAMEEQNTPEQARLLAAGKIDEWERTQFPEIPKVADNSTPDAFVQDVLPAATKLLQGTSIFPEVATAIAALESGFGKNVKKMNYFGIKGAGQTFVTTEHEGDEDKTITAEFKVFESLPHAIQEFRNFLYDNPRYKAALAAKTPKAQVEELKKAGYATDRDYIEKIINVMSQPRFTLPE